MIKVTFTQEQLKRAKELYEFGHLNNSITGGASNIYGALGEIIIYDLYDAKYAGEFDYDLIINGYRVDVKSKWIQGRPQPHYFATVADTSTHQDCDCYVFLRIAKNYEFQKFAFIIGWKMRDDFFNEATFYNEGDIDPTDGRNFKIKADCWNLEQRYLNNIEDDLVKC